MVDPCVRTPPRKHPTKNERGNKTTMYFMVWLAADSLIALLGKEKEPDRGRRLSLSLGGLIEET